MIGHSNNTVRDTFFADFRPPPSPLGDIWEYFPPILKKFKYRNKSKSKEKDKESYTFIVFSIFNIN